jgi:hypothetical protein
MPGPKQDKTAEIEIRGGEVLCPDHIDVVLYKKACDNCPMRMGYGRTPPDERNETRLTVLCTRYPILSPDEVRTYDSAYEVFLKDKDLARMEREKKAPEQQVGSNETEDAEEQLRRSQPKQFRDQEDN